MEPIRTFNLYIVYSWTAIKNYLNQPQEKDNVTRLYNLLAKKDLVSKEAFDNALPLWHKQLDPVMISTIIENLKDNKELSQVQRTYLALLKSLLEEFFSVFLDTVSSNTECLKRLEYIIDELKQLLNNPLAENSRKFIDILKEISVQLKAKYQTLESLPENNNDYYAIYLIIESYFQCFNSGKIINNNTEDLNIFIELYTRIINKNIHPIFILSEEEENVCVDTTSFPDDILLKVLETLDINIASSKEYFITASIGSKFMANNLYKPIFAHEIGHLIDLNYINLSKRMLNELMSAYPEFFTRVNDEMVQWVREIVADAVAMVLSGPAYMFALITYIDNEEIMKANNRYPSIQFRANILHNYLFHSELMSLFTRENLIKLQNKLLYFENNYKTDNNLFIEYENILLQATGLIYQLISEFLYNVGIYCSYDELVRQICLNDGNLEKTRESLTSGTPDIRKIIVLYNINWLIELKEDKYKLL